MKVDWNYLKSLFVSNECKEVEAQNARLIGEANVLKQEKATLERQLARSEESRRSAEDDAILSENRAKAAEQKAAEANAKVEAYKSRVGSINEIDNFIQFMQQNGGSSSTQIIGCSMPSCFKGSGAASWVLGDGLETF